MTAPHLNPSAAPVTIRTGAHWIPGEITQTPFGSVPRGPLYVKWIAPEQVTQPHPLVLVHGGGGQGNDFLTTPDGRPGWAYDLASAGYAVYVVDRPGHGRSPHHPDVLGQCAPPFPLELAAAFFAPSENADRHTQWPWGRGFQDAQFAQLASSFGFLMADLAASQELDGQRLAQLLELIGPSVLITHSAGAPGGWLAANRRPELVVGTVAVEPMGPPFAEFPGLGELTYGVSYGQPRIEPELSDPQQLKADPAAYRIPGIAEHPILVVTSEISILSGAGPATVEFLNAVGGHAELLHLPDQGIRGNGHGLIFERNSSEIAQLVAKWIGALDLR